MVSWVNASFSPDDSRLFYNHGLENLDGKTILVGVVKEKLFLHTMDLESHMIALSLVEIVKEKA